MIQGETCSVQLALIIKTHFLCAKIQCLVYPPGVITRWARTITSGFILDKTAGKRSNYSGFFTTSLL